MEPDPHTKPIVGGTQRTAKRKNKMKRKVASAVPMVISSPEVGAKVPGAGGSVPPSSAKSALRADLWLSKEDGERRCSCSIELY